MFRTRRTAQLLIVLACLGWGGYQITSGVLARPEAVNSSSGAVVDQDSQALADKYPDLLPGVAAAVGSVVATQRLTGTPTGNVQNGLAGSGVVINDTQILTAGHNVEDGTGLACEQTLVLSPGALTRASASKEVVTHASVEYGQDDDIAVLAVAASDNFKALSNVPIAERLPDVGEVVFLINFQPTGDGTGRSPFAGDAALAEPAVFSATYLGSNGGRFALALGGGKSFGRGIPDVLLRKGASGGAVVNSKGELIGLTVASESLAANRSAESLRREYRVDMPAGSYQVAFVQQAAGGLISRLQSGMVSCGGR